MKRICANNIIEEDVFFGKDVKIGHYNVIEAGVTIGDNVIIENFCEIQKNARIGDNVWIRSYSRIGVECVVEDQVIIKCGAIFGPRTLLKRAAFIGPQVICTSNLELHETGTILGENSFIGAGTKIMPSIQIGSDVIIGAQALVNRDCLNPGTYVGVPVRKIK